MITKINLPQRVPFTEPSELDGIKRVCFIFGPNGSGKTTISRLIHDEAKSQDSSVLEWTDGPHIKTYVYNRDFVSRNFKAEIPGVFTMGSENIDAKKTIDKLTAQIDKDQREMEKEQENLNQAQKDLKQCESEIIDECWKVKSELPKVLQNHWVGTGRKAKFKEDVFSKIESLTQNDTLPNIAELESKALVIFDESVQAPVLLPPYKYTDLLDSENAPIFTRTIVGKENVAIGDLIKKLGNSDWVAQGRKYVNGDVCPFCQQHSVDEKLKSELESFFDESYQTDISELKVAAENYKKCSNQLIETATNISVTYKDFVDSASLKMQIAELKRVVQNTTAQINKKLAEPSRIINVTSANAPCSEIAKLIDDAILKVNERKELVEHRKEEQKKLLDDLMLFTAIKTKERTESLRGRKSNLQKKIAGLTKTIEATTARINTSTKSREEEEKRLTNIKETAEQINGLLHRFGFTNFKVSVTDDNKSYQVVRNDGTLANDTLSEGEASFLTFLYFYHLMNGSLDSTGVNDRRVVVIDDPISSMDADVLFVASSLVRKLAQEARGGEGTTEQLIVLTHNITFHREVTYVRVGEGDAQTSYYAIRKVEGRSIVERCNKNPVSSTYEMLWEDLCRSDCNALTAQNVSRRITETFFRLVGVPDTDKIIAEMESPDREIARSLMLWANAGSHSAFDDETFVNTSETTNAYRKALGLLFEKANYGSHYDEMTKKYSASV